MRNELSNKIYLKNRDKIAHLKTKFAREIEARKLTGRRQVRQHRSRLPSEIHDYRDLEVFSDTESGYGSDTGSDDDEDEDCSGDDDVCSECRDTEDRTPVSNVIQNGTDEFSPPTTNQMDNLAQNEPCLSPNMPPETDLISEHNSKPGVYGVW